MAIYNQADWDKFDDELFNNILARSVNTDDTSKEHLLSYQQEASQTIATAFGGRNADPSGARARATRTLSSKPSWDEGVNPRTFSLGETEEEFEPTGTTFAESYLSKPENAQTEMKDAMFRAAKMQSWDYAAEQSVQRWAHKGDPTMTPEEANMQAKEEGADIKFDHPVNDFELQQSINAYKRREQLQANMAQASQYRDESFGKNAAVMGSALMGSIGPVELAATLGLSWILPEAAVGATVKGATLARGMLGVKRVEDAAKAVRAAKNVNTALNAARTVGAEANSVIGVVLKNNTAAGAAKFLKTEEAILKADAALEKLSTLSVEGLSNAGKVGLDTLTFAATDIPFIQGTLSNAQQMGFDLYDEKDKATDTLMALGLGVVLPGVGRNVGKFLGFMPTGLLNRKLDTAAIDIKTKKALGQISEEEARQAEKAISDIRGAISEQSKMIKQPHPSIQKAVEDLRRINVDNETLIAQQSYLLGALMDGRRPKLSELPEFQSRMSHIDAEVIRRLLGESFDSVFAGHLLRDISEGKFASVKVMEETGLLGDKAVGALSEQAAMTNIERLYKGMILGDKQALEQFKQYATSFDNFVNAMQDLVSDYTFKYETNIEAKRLGNKPVYSAYSLPQLEKSMKEAYIKLWFNEGDEATALLEKMATNENSRRLGFADVPYEDAETEALNAFDDWFKKFVKKSEKGFTDFVDDAGKKDVGRSFQEYVKQLSELAQDNKYLAQVDDTVKMWEQDKVSAIINSVNEREVPFDTDYQHLFAEPRVTGAEYAQQSGDRAFWNGRLAQSKMEYAEIMSTPEYKKAIDTLSASSVINKETGSLFTRATARIDKIRELKNIGYEGIKKSAIEKIRTNENFLDKMENLSDPNKRALNFMFRKAVEDSLAEAGLDSTFINVSRLTANVGDRFSKIMDEHPEYLEAFSNAQDLKAKYQTQYEAAWENLYAEIPEKGVDEGAFKKVVEDYVTKPVAQINTVYNQIFDELLDTVDIELSRAEMQSMYNVNLAVKAMNAMLELPESAGEVLEGLATQSHGMQFGSGMSVEYLTKTAGFYMADLKNTLAKMDSRNGVSLLDVFRSNDSSVKAAIQESMIRRRYGEVTGNADADRIAEVIDNQMSTFLASFRKFGSNYDGLSAAGIKRSNLKYIDGYITDTVEGEIGDAIQKNFPDTVLDDVLKVAQKGDRNATVKWGTAGEVAATPDFKKKLDKDLQTTVGTLSKLFNQMDPSSRKMAIWAFRDFDLDRMFDPNHTEALSLNEVRDMLLSGKLQEYLSEDLYRIKLVNKSLKRIVSTLVGNEKKLIQVDGSYLTRGDSWVMRFRSGFNDIGAIATGRRAAALDAMESGIHFKNPEAEIAVVQRCGYDSIQEQVIDNYQKMLQAYETIDKFGTNPHEMVEMLIDTFENARKKGDYADFLSKRYVETTKTKKGPGMDAEIAQGIAQKYSITENKKKEILDMVDMASGLQNYSPSSMTKVLKSIMRMLSTGLLAKAGFKSIADYGTVAEGMITNGIVSGRGEAWAMMAEVRNFLVKPENRDLRDMCIAANILEHDALAKRYTNDVGADMISLSTAASRTDKFNDVTNKMADTMLRSFGLSYFTNHNKQVAATVLQMGMGMSADIPYKALNQNLQFYLYRSGITEQDWDFMRATMFWDPVEYMNKQLGTNRKAYGKKFFLPLSIREVPDEVFRKELMRRGERNVTDQTVAEFKNDFIGKTWSMIDSASDEMVSIPSNRISYYLRGGQSRNSRIATGMEVVTQFQSFPAALLYNTYYRRLQSFAHRETGINVFDIITGKGALRNTSRRQIYGDLLQIMAHLALVNLAVNVSAQTLAGRIQQPTPENIFEDVQTALVDSTGIAAPLLNGFIDAQETAGLKGGGFSLQVAPSIASLARTQYRLTKPLKNEKIESKGTAFAAGIVNELARYTGLKTAPLVAPIYQWLFGSYTDSVYSGGDALYREQQERAEKRGQWIAPWETGQPLGGLLQ